MALLRFSDSILDRILANNGIMPDHYDPAVDEGIPFGYGINGTQFSLSFMETHEPGINANQSRLSDHVTDNKVQALETFWNVQAGGEGETEIAWLVDKYQNATDRDRWVQSISRLFSCVEMDAKVGVGLWRAAGDNGYTVKQNLKDWVNAITV